MTTFPYNPEDKPAPLSSEEEAVLSGIIEQAQLQGIQSWPDDKRALDHMRDRMLADAPHFSLGTLSMGEIVLIRTEDDRLLQFSITPWSDDAERIDHMPVLARSILDDDGVIADAKPGDLFGINGASIGDYQRREDLGWLALECNMTYANVKRKPYVKTAENRPPVMVERLKELGLIGFVNGVHIETNVDITRKFTPPIAGGQFGTEGKAIF